MINEIEKRIGKNLKTLREKRGFTQEYVATKLQLGGCDVTRSSVAKIEVGQRHVYPDEITVLKNIFNCSYEYIFDLSQL